MLDYTILLLKALAFLILPGFFWLYLFSNPKLFISTKKALLPVFAMGVLVSIPAITIEYFYILIGKLIETKLMIFISTFFIIAPIEEYLKSLAVDIAGYSRNEKGTPIQILSWYCAAAIGFASIENVLYFLVFGSQVFFYRLIITTVAHITCSGIIAIFIGKGLKKTGDSYSFFKGYFLASFLHGLYDFCINLYPITIWIWVPFFLFFVSYLEYLLNEELEENDVTCLK
jgi:RsiW-degrading membrane proteinase PrsW (M82 family)